MLPISVSRDTDRISIESMSRYIASQSSPDMLIRIIFIFSPQFSTIQSIWCAVHFNLAMHAKQFLEVGMKMEWMYSNICSFRKAQNPI
jgi:hypothetical protein